MDSAIDMLHPSDALDLSKIRYQLIRLEDTIIFHIIERVQFPYNSRIYLPPTTAGGLPLPDSSHSFLGYILHETERLHARVRRYQAPDEYPFFPDNLPEPLLPPLSYPQLLHPNSVNLNNAVMDAYINHFLPEACGVRPTATSNKDTTTKSNTPQAERAQAQENYGSCAVIDVLCLQALSRRVHFGKFVAEAKFLKDTPLFTSLIRARDIAGITREITDEKVEMQVLERLRRKATNYGRDPALGDAADQADAHGPLKVNVDAVVNLYKDWIIPLTKRVEIDYLLTRLD
ncbi:chorismate mutase [Peziza echinospora]|nr:chorismate mutase [Peziza echinospora]